MPRQSFLTLSAIIAGAVCMPANAQNATAGVPSTPVVSAPANNGVYTLANDQVELKISVQNGRFYSALFTDKVNGGTYDLGTDIFRVKFAQPEAPKDDQGIEDGEYGRGPVLPPISAANLRAEAPIVESLKADPQARRLVDRRNGTKITIPFAWIPDGLNFQWSAEIHEGTPYVRLAVTITSENFNPAEVREITVLDFKASDAKVVGSVQGAPVTVNGNRLFMGIEHPLGINEVTKEGNVVAKMVRKLDIPRRSPLVTSAVLGASTPGQMRRTFQISYINEERARPYGAFLNYNTWYDIGYFDPYDEKAALNVVNTYGEELVKKRGVKMDSFLFDDGWDDTKTLWKFHKGLPNEFKNVRKAAESFGAGPGVWFSPWGGYGQPKESRLAAANGKFETNESGFALSGPKYYEHFKQMCMHMMKENGINHFKLDGTSGVETQIPGSKFSSDFEAIISLINEMRNFKKDLYVNLTTGTWASPFWFGIADSIWRGNWDHAFLGEGTMRNKWITFRDYSIYKNNVEISPMFPINSLMTHGVIYTKRAYGLDKVEGNDLNNEIWSGFASGTQMQEIYVSPGLLTSDQWDTLAAAAKWSRANGETLIDTHWVGGDPKTGAVYGWAAWSPKKGILTLRNPASTSQTYTFDPSGVFELPVGAATTYTLSSPKGDKLPAETIQVGKPTTVTLQPYEVLILEATPVTK